MSLTMKITNYIMKQDTMKELDNQQTGVDPQSLQIFKLLVSYYKTTMLTVFQKYKTNLKINLKNYKIT